MIPSKNPEVDDLLPPPIEPQAIFEWLRQRTRIVALIGALWGTTSTQAANAQPSPDHGLKLPDPFLKEKETLNSPSLLPEFPVSSKLAVIVNGDVEGEKHVQNVERAMEVLRGKGFEDFFIVSDQKLKEVPTGSVCQFAGTLDGMGQLFSELGKEGRLKKDSLVFFYVTGHGEKGNDGACIDLRDGCYAQQKMVGNLQAIKDAGARGIFVFDGCYSGSFPSAIMESGIEGVALSPGVEGKETACQSFSKPFFEGIAKGYDPNKDGVSEPSEWFQAAMAAYKISVDPVNGGSYSESRPELSYTNIDEILKTKKSLLIDVNATWCAPCKVYSKTLDQLTPMVAGQLKIVKLTEDTHGKEELEGLFEKIGVERPQGVPTTLLRGKDGHFKAKTGAIPLPDLLALLKSNGIEANTDALVEALQKESKQSKTTIRRYIALGILDPKIISLGDDPKAVFLKLAKTVPLIAFQNIPRFKDDNAYYSQLLERAARNAAIVLPEVGIEVAVWYKDQPYYKEVLEKAVRNLLALSSMGALRLSNHYKDQPYYAEVLEKAARTMVTRNPFFLLMCAEDFKGQPWAKEVISKATHQSDMKEWAADTHASAFEMLPGYKDQPWAKEVAQSIAVENPELAFQFIENYKEQPWASEIIEKAAEQYPESALGYSALFEEQPWAEGVVKNAAGKIPERVFVYFGGFKNQPWAKEVVMSVMEKDPESALTQVSSYKDQPWAKAVLLSLAERIPDRVFVYVERYKDQPWAGEVVEKALESNPEKAFVYFRDFEDQPWAGYIIGKAAEKVPNRFFVYADDFKGQPWLNDVIERAKSAKILLTKIKK